MHLLAVFAVSWIAVSLVFALACGRILRRADKRPVPVRTTAARVRTVA
jgi:hypothetical protein